VSVTSNTSGEKKSPSSDASASASATLRTLRATQIRWDWVAN